MKYRYPTNLMHSNDGMREVIANDYDEAIRAFRRQWPSMRIEGPCVQVYHAGSWHFAETIPQHLGGYDREKRQSM